MGCRRKHGLAPREGGAFGAKSCTRPRQRPGGTAGQGWDLGRMTRPGAVSELRAGTGQGAGWPAAEARACGRASERHPVGRSASRPDAEAPRRRRARAVRSGRRGTLPVVSSSATLLLEHLDRLVGERDEPVELLAHAAVGELPLGRASRPGRSRREQLLRGVEALALDLGERRVLEAPRIALGDVERDLEVGDRVAVVGELRLFVSRALADAGRRPSATRLARRNAAVSGWRPSLIAGNAMSLATSSS